MQTLHDLLRQDADASASKGPGDVQIGGILGQPHLSLSYARAARALRDLSGPTGHEPDVVAPIVFCARHAVELALKDLLTAYQENQLMQAELEEHDGLTPTTKPLRADVLDGVSKTHDLGQLLAWIAEWMPSYVKAEWKDLVEHIDSYENNAFERFRYSTIRMVDKQRGRRLAPSFERVVVIQIDKLLAQLEVFMKEAAHIAPPRDMGDDWSALQDLAMCSQSLAQDLYARGLL